MSNAPATRLAALQIETAKAARANVHPMHPTLAGLPLQVSTGGLATLWQRNHPRGFAQVAVLGGVLDRSTWSPIR